MTNPDSSHSSKSDSIKDKIHSVLKPNDPPRGEEQQQVPSNRMAAQNFADRTPAGDVAAEKGLPTEQV